MLKIKHTKMFVVSPCALSLEKKTKTEKKKRKL